jgi:O-antigen/teichoic acid export membrane protein
MLIQGASSRILFGMSKHGKLAVVTMAEGIANLALSILLVRPYGILGDAFGTAIPMLGTYLVFMPRHLCSRLGIRVSTYLRHSYLLPVLTCVPLVLVLLLMQYFFVAHGYRQLFVQLLAAAIVYGSCLTWAYMSGKALHVGNVIASVAEPARQVEMITSAIETLPEDV